MRSKAWFAFYRNMKNLRALSSPLQDEIRQLEAQEEKLRREYTTLEHQMTTTEVCARGNADICYWLVYEQRSHIGLTLP
jgi:hypothetical protein